MALTIASEPTVYGSGPVTVNRHLSNGTTIVTKTRAATKVRPLRWINFNDPRVKTSTGSMEGDWFFTPSS